MQVGRQIARAVALAGLMLGVSTSVHGAPLTVNTEQGMVHGKTIDDTEKELIHFDSTITAGPDALRPQYEFLLK